MKLLSTIVLTLFLSSNVFATTIHNEGDKIIVYPPLQVAPTAAAQLHKTLTDNGVSFIMVINHNHAHVSVFNINDMDGLCGLSYPVLEKYDGLETVTYRNIELNMTIVCKR